MVFFQHVYDCSCIESSSGPKHDGAPSVRRARVRAAPRLAPHAAAPAAPPVRAAVECRAQRPAGAALRLAAPLHAAPAAPAAHSPSEEVTDSTYPT